MRGKSLVIFMVVVSILALGFLVYSEVFSQEESFEDPLRNSLVCNYQGEQYRYGDSFSEMNITCGSNDMGVPYYSSGGLAGESRGNKEKCSCEGISFFTDKPNASDSRDFYYCVGDLRNCSRFNLSRG